MENIAPCPTCGSQYTYPLDALMICPDCGLEWNPSDTVSPGEEEFQVKDSNGALLANGDSVVIVKDLPVKGAPNQSKLEQK